MTLKECYAALEGDYDNVLTRLMTEKLVHKFVMKFLDDGSFQNLKNDIAAEKYDEAFREAHTLKGVCQNLSFTKLYESSNRITEALRNGNIAEAGELMPLVEADYMQTVSAIKQLG
ncbi:MAG: Hpt domain-containing protein [Alistipes sp.]|nr:Hpt domain-containing protein [Alistipes sp.]